MSDTVAAPEVEGFARTYLLDRIVDSLLEASAPLKVSEVLSAVQHDGSLTSRLLRAVMESSERFQPVDRRWALAPIEVDPRRPLQAGIDQVFATHGRPLTAQQIAGQIAESVGRPPEVLTPAVAQVLERSGRYFAVAEGGPWAPRTWLLDMNDHDEDEVVFRNFFSEDEERELAAFRERLDRFEWDRANLTGSAVGLLEQAHEPVPNKVLQFLAWRVARRAFHPEAFFSALFQKDDVLLLSTGHWCSSELVGDFTQVLHSLSEQLAEQAGPAPEEGREGPLVFEATEKEINDIAALLADLKSHRISEIIETIFELSPGDRDYQAAFGSVWGAMGADERFAWVGGERWRLAGTVPRMLHKIPDILELPYLPYFVDEDGNPVDVELDEAGFEGDLLDSVRDPRVMIAGQPVPEGTVPPEPPARVRTAVRYEHRLAGTLPVYGDLRALFPAQPDIIELTFHWGSRSYTGWLNNTHNLVLELGAFYDRLDLPLCGGAFHLQPRGRGVTTDYTVAYTPGDVDELVAVSDERLAELEAMREGPDSAQTSTFDLMRSIMQAHKKGLHFVTLFTELNVVRRTHAYLIASLLSAYACFTYLRPGYWAYDEKKVDQGIRKQKRKFIKE